MKRLSFMVLLLSSSMLFSMTDDEWQRRADPANPEKKVVDEALAELVKKGGDSKKAFTHYLLAANYDHPITMQPYLSLLQNAGVLDKNNYPKIVYSTRFKR